MNASLLLPPQVLSSGWFHAFSLFVAANTIIYLGLTLAKFVPWPKQVHPDRVRALLGGNEEEAPLVTPADLEAGNAASRSAVLLAGRRAVAARSIYRALGLLGLLVIVVNVVDQLFSSRENRLLGAVAVGFGVVAILAALTLGRRRDRSVAAEWTWSILAVLFVLAQCLQAVRFHNPLDVADAIIVLVVIPPVSLSWPASVTSSSLAAGATAAAALKLSGSAGVGAVITVLAAMVAGFVLLYLRATSVDESTLARLALRQHATSDPVTGLLSVQALQALAPNLTRLAGSSGQPLHLLRIRIEGIEQLRRDYGPPYGRAVRVAVAEVLAELCPSGELLADVGDGSYLLAGIGELTPDALQAQLAPALAARTVALGKSALNVTASQFAITVGEDLEAVIGAARLT